MQRGSGLGLGPSKERDESYQRPFKLGFYVHQAIEDYELAMIKNKMVMDRDRSILMVGWKL